MKIQSNIPIPDTLKWKGEQMLIAINHKENPVINEEDEGRKYEADFTVIDKLTADATIQAFTRQQEDKELDDAVIHGFEIEGKKAIEIEKEYPQKVSTSIFKPLPDSGWLKKGTIYSYNNGAVMVVQEHERTIYIPEETPALFSFHREITEGQEWIPQEKVELTETRTFEGKTYNCIQSHTTQEDWTPDVTPSLWEEVLTVEDYPVWVQPTGAHDAYNTGDIVYYPTEVDGLWISKIDANTTVPDGDEPYNRYWEPYTE